ncbi:response regulator [Microbacterium sp. GXF6406]
MADVSVLLVDDERLVRMGLRLLLDGADGIRIVGEATDGLDAIALARRLRPDVILMDIRMPHLDGIRAAERILHEAPDARIMMLTTFDADAQVLGALESGAVGYLLKDTPPAELVSAVLEVAAGRIRLSPSVVAQVIDAATNGRESGRRQAAQERLARLSAREREIADAVALGLSNAEVAAKLFLSIATVKTHVGRIMDKLPAQNRVQIAICVHDAA